MLVVSLLLLASYTLARRMSSHDSAPTSDSSFASNDQSSVYDFYDMTPVTDGRENLEILKDLEQLKVENEKLREELEKCNSNLLNSALTKTSQFDRIPLFFW